MKKTELNRELSRCLGCKLKPCQKACPLGVSPHDFIALAKSNDFKKAAADIASHNPLPRTCGLVCPDFFCQKACIRSRIDTAIEIPCLQAEIMRRGGYPPLSLKEPQNKRVAVIGGGPAGLGALYEFILAGWHVDIYEQSSSLGGAMRLIPKYRLPKSVLNFEIKRLTENELVTVHLNTKITDFESLKQEYDEVVLALGETKTRNLEIKGEHLSLPYHKYLQSPTRYKAKKIAVTGGGEVATDCALTAKKNGAEIVEMFVRRRKEDMRISSKNYKDLVRSGVIIRELSSVTEITQKQKSLSLKVIKNTINEQGKAEPCLTPSKTLHGYDMLIQALGSYYPKDETLKDFSVAGDMTGLCGTVVQAIASGRITAKKIITREE